MGNTRFEIIVKYLLMGVAGISCFIILMLLGNMGNPGMPVNKSFLVMLAIPVLGFVGYYMYQRQLDKLRKAEEQLMSERMKIATSQRYLNEVASGNLAVEIAEEKTEGGIFLAIDKLKASLYKAQEDEKNRIVDDQKRNWTNEGMAKFGEILRNSDNDFTMYCYNIISNLAKYLDAKQGGIFMLNDDDKNDIFLELKACFAYDRKKFVQKEIRVGEGLVGACLFEKQTIYMSNVPNNYVSITSGLGGENPRSILIVPLKLNEDVCGIIELASFNFFDDYQINFVEKIAESIASSITNAKINIRTAYLLEQSQQQAEEMKAQEEEMRQNNEELMATQEEISRQNQEMQHYQKMMLGRDEKLKKAAKELELVEKKLKGNIERLKQEA